MEIETIENIQSLVSNKVEESINLEYKRELITKDIAKEISAFANTEGGTIIFGILEKERTPVEINWLKEKGIKERIQQIASTAIHPKIETLKVTRIPNPSNDEEAIFIVHIAKSALAPHMVDNRYYKRHGSVSSPMDDIEVRNAMFGSGRIAALRFEIKQNLELIRPMLQLIERVYVLPQDQRQMIALIPFGTDAFNSIVASGLLSSLRPAIAEKLVKAYRLIREVNSLMEWFKVSRETIVHTPVYPGSTKHGTYLPAIFQDKLPALYISLKEIMDQLEHE